MPSMAANSAKADAVSSPTRTPAALINDDFLSQHLSHLLVRQPTSTKQQHAQPSSSAAASSSSNAHVSRSSSNASAVRPKEACSSRVASPKAQLMSVGSSSNGFTYPSTAAAAAAIRRGPSSGAQLTDASGSTPCAAPSAEPLISPTDVLFSSFFVDQSGAPFDSLPSTTSTREGELGHLARRLSASWSTKASPLPSGSGASQTAASKRSSHARRGPASVSMSTSFGARRRRSSIITAPEWTVGDSSDSSSVTSHSSLSSHLQKPALQPPAFLGRTPQYYQSNGTAATTPPESVKGSAAAEGSQTESSSPDWTSMPDKQSAFPRWPSLTTSSGATSSSESPSTSDSVAPLSESPLGSSASGSSAVVESNTLDRDWESFHQGEAMEPPDATIDMPCLTQSGLSAGVIASSARHTSMISARGPVSKRTSVATSGTSALDTQTGSVNECPSDENAQAATFQLDNRRAIFKSGTSIRSSGSSTRAFSSGGATQDDPLGEAIKKLEVQQKASRPLSTQQEMHPRKQGITLVPSGDDGRTFKFVSIP